MRQRFIKTVRVKELFMKRNKIVRIILAAILVCLIILSAVFYAVDIIANNTPPTKNLFKALAAIFICAGSLARLFVKKGRRSLEYYESQYSNEIGNAFANAPFYRKKLLCAIRLYNEDNMAKALKYLGQLKQVSKERDDLYAVGLFTALVFTDMGCVEDAIVVYNALIKMDITSTTIYGNLGSIYSGMGNYNYAIACSRLAIQNDENNPAPYNNLAKLYFDTYDFENAKEYALKALKINHKFTSSATLLAVIYSLENDKENFEKYSHIAISSGENPARLQRIIERYQTKIAEENPEDPTEYEDE